MRQRSRPRREASHPSDMGERPWTVPLNRSLLVFRRWWWIPAVIVTGSVVVSWISVSRRPAEYTAEAVLQRTASQSSFLTAFTMPNVQAAQEIASEIEIIRGRSVLRLAVEELSLRLVLQSESLRRTEVLESVHLAEDSPSGSYRITRTDTGLRLTDLQTDSVLWRGAPDETVVGPGLRIRLHPTAEPATVEFRILDWEAAIDQLRRSLSLDDRRGTTLIYISRADTDPEFAAEVVNAVARAYAEEDARRAREVATRRKEFIRDQLQNVSDSLSAAQGSLLGYQEDSRTLDPEMESRTLYATMQSAEETARNLAFSVRQLESLIAALDNADNDGTLSRVVSLSSELLPIGSGLYNRLQTLEDERRRLTDTRFGYTDRDPRVEQIDLQIETLQAELRDVAEQSLEVARAQQVDAQENAAEIRSSINRLPARAARFGALEQQVSAVQRANDGLAERYFEAQMAEAVETGNVEIIDWAAVPIRPDPQFSLLLVLVSGLLGLVLSAGALGVADALNPSVAAVDDAEALAGVDALGVIPSLEKLGGEGEFAEEELAEAFRTLSIMMRYALAESPKVLLIASAAPGDGKSFIAANLARVLGARGDRVLLVDADLRRPTHAISRRGLAQVLTEEVSWRQALHEDAPVTILPAGAWVGPPANLLDSAGFGTMIAEIRQEFDHVIIDAPALLAVPDARAIAATVDAVLLVARIGSTRRTALASAARQLAVLDVPIAGLVVNGTDRLTGYARYAEYSDEYLRARGEGRWAENGDHRSAVEADAVKRGDASRRSPRPATRPS